MDLQDGRSVTMPISAFPSLKKLPVKERENWYLMGGGVTWDSCPEVIHIEQILGNYKNYAHEAVWCIFIMLNPKITVPIVSIVTARKFENIPTFLPLTL